MAIIVAPTLGHCDIIIPLWTCYHIRGTIVAHQGIWRGLPKTANHLENALSFFIEKMISTKRWWSSYKEALCPYCIMRFQNGHVLPSLVVHTCTSAWDTELLAPK